MKTIKQVLTKLGPMDHYVYLSQSDLLRLKDDYNMIETTKSSAGPQNTNRRSYEISIVNSKKIITGIAVPYYCDVSLPTRTVKNVFEVGFTFEESLYFYAFGMIKIEIRKAENQTYVRDTLKSQLYQLMKKKKEGWATDITIEDRMLLQKSLSSNPEKMTDIQVYG